MIKNLLIMAALILRVTPSMALEIISVEQPQFTKVLTSQALPVTFPLSFEDKQLITEMKAKLQQLGGVGLAAPQVKVAKQIVAIYIPEEAALLREQVNHFYPMHILINPSYEPINKARTVYDYESCYSVSSKAGKVPRYDAIQLSYFDETGKWHQQQESGFYARVLQHEIDHLQGILITNRLTKDCVQGTFEEMMALRRAELSPEKRALFDKVVARKKKK